MKKIIFAIALFLTMGFSTSAQSDGFFRGDSGAGDDRTTGSSNSMPLLPLGSTGSRDNDQPATVPVGSGLLVMTVLGGAYLLRKQEK